MGRADFQLPTPREIEGRECFFLTAGKPAGPIRPFGNAGSVGLPEAG